MTPLCFQLVNDVKQKLPFKDDENKENVGANPMGVVKMEESLDQQLEKTKFGPKAIMKKGVLGNYEPNYQIKSGPGMWVAIFIRKTCNMYPLIPHFYIVKLGYAGVRLFFLFLLQNIDCGYSCTHNLCFEQK